MNSDTTPNPPPLPLRTRMAFGWGGSAEYAVNITFNTFSFLFYNNVLGLSGTLCGLAVTIALLFDAVSDPLMGMISDRFRSRLGRRHPFLYASAIPYGLCIYLLFSPPAGLESYSLFAWMAGFSILLHLAQTLYQIPHLALGAELSRDYHQRSAIMSYTMLFGVFGGALVYFLTWTFIKHRGGAESAGISGFSDIGLVVGIFVAISILISAHFTRDRIPLLYSPPPSARLTWMSLVREIRHCLRNRNFQLLVIGMAFFSLAWGIRETVHAYMSLFYWGLPEGHIRFFGMAVIPGILLAFIFTPRAHRVVSKRATAMAALVVAMTAAALPVLARMAGVMPVNGDAALFPLLLTSTFLWYTGAFIYYISLSSALADVADEHELHANQRQEGLIYSARIFFGKLSSGLGHLLAGVIIDLIGFPAGARPGEVGESTLFSLGLLDGVLTALPILMTLIVLARYNIDHTRHREIHATLVGRGQSSSETATVTTLKG